ncbi:hypothetical protein [Streptomyces sp. NPDC023588]|uniref:hypothetical protein n=1 Tax=Streptomyces sp. NPDC023588 TaxID=3154907 RepID=UPI0033C2C86A
MTVWVRCFWDEEAVRFSFELDPHGYVIGLTAEPPVSEWEGYDPQALSADEFEIALPSEYGRV